MGITNLALLFKLRNIWERKEAVYLTAAESFRKATTAKQYKTRRRRVAKAEHEMNVTKQNFINARNKLVKG